MCNEEERGAFVFNNSVIKASDIYSKSLDHKKILGTVENNKNHAKVKKTLPKFNEPLEIFGNLGKFYNPCEHFLTMGKLHSGKME